MSFETVALEKTLARNRSTVRAQTESVRRVNMSLLQGIASAWEHYMSRKTCLDIMQSRLMGSSLELYAGLYIPTTVVARSSAKQIDLRCVSTRQPAKGRGRIGVLNGLQRRVRHR